jgi:hypothetical protein
MFVIEILGDNARSEGFIMEADFELNGPNYPTGSVTCTHDKRCAMTFAGRDQAIAFYLTRSRTCPTRPDGKPNRPLTGLTVLIRQMENDL